LLIFLSFMLNGCLAWPANARVLMPNRDWNVVFMGPLSWCRVAQQYPPVCPLPHVRATYFRSITGEAAHPRTVITLAGAADTVLGQVLRALGKEPKPVLAALKYRAKPVVD
jgi:hypothetical protein